MYLIKFVAIFNTYVYARVESVDISNKIMHFGNVHILHSNQSNITNNKLA